MKLPVSARPSPPIGPRTLAWLAVPYGAVFFLISYFANAAHPSHQWQGWYGAWFDQRQYFLMAAAMHQGNLGPFQYPAAYPFLGFLGSFLLPYDPFLIPDLVLFGVFCYFSTRMLADLLDSAVLTLAASAFVIQASAAMFAVPWTTTVSAVCLAVLLFLCFDTTPLTARTGAIAGLCVGMMFAARVGDVIPGIAVFAVLIFTRRGNWFLAAAAGCAAAIAAIALAVNRAFSGLWLGNYYNALIHQTWCTSCIPGKLYGYLLNPYQAQGVTDPQSMPLVQILPLLLLAPLGLLFLLLDPKHRIKGIAFAAAFVAWTALYGPFWAVTGATLRNGSMHYAKMLFPALTACSFWALIVISRPTRTERRIALVYGVAVVAVVIGVAIV